MQITELATTNPDFDARLRALLHWELDADGSVARIVREVIAAIESRGDAALLEYSRRFDRVDADSIQALSLGAEDFAQAFARIGDEERVALETAARRIRDYHERQLSRDWSFEDEYGNRLGQRVTALGRVGLYVPGGQATYPSSVLMTAIPAKVAGVPEVILTVPTPDGVRSDLLLAAAHVSGVDRGFTIGGAQAIAALAHGTEAVPRVDKIVGPGGVFVTEAKRIVYGRVGIDMIAGPSEVLVIADGSAPAEWVAFDLFSQAEHDPAAQSLLLCPDKAYLDEVKATMRRLLPERLRCEVIRESLARRGGLILTRSLAEAIEVANRVAPEHLQLAVDDPQSWLAKIENAGAIFLGAHSPEVMGDYIAGPSHVLPTYGTARFSSPLGVYDFQKRSSVIALSEPGARALAGACATLATGEGLEAHAGSARLRLSGVDEGC